MLHVRSGGDTDAGNLEHLGRLSSVQDEYAWTMGQGVLAPGCHLMTYCTPQHHEQHHQACSQKVSLNVSSVWCPKVIMDMVSFCERL